MNAKISQKSPLAGKTKVGLGLATFLGLGDVASLATIGQQLQPGQDGPPAGVTVASALLGVITLVGVVIAWRARSRPAMRVIVGARIVSMILGLPAFFVSGVPAGWVVVTALFVVVTLVCVMLVLAKPKSGETAGSAATTADPVDLQRA